MAELVLPRTDVHASFLEAMAEFRAEGRGTRPSGMLDSDIREYGPGWADPGQFAAYVAWLLDQRRESAPRPAAFVPCTTLWLVSGSEFLGRIAIRHRLTPFLLESGGHIGYDIRPSARRRGNATAMLAAALPAARRLGIDPALVTCDDGNIGSRKVIEANGGVFEDQRGVKLRFWVPTAPAS